MAAYTTSLAWKTFKIFGTARCHERPAGERYQTDANRPTSAAGQARITTMLSWYRSPDIGARGDTARPRPSTEPVAS